MGQIIGNSGPLGPPQVLLSGFCELDPHTHRYFQSVEGTLLAGRVQVKLSGLAASCQLISNKEAWLSFNT